MGKRAARSLLISATMTGHASKAMRLIPGADVDVETSWVFHADPVKPTEWGKGDLKLNIIFPPGLDEVADLSKRGWDPMDVFREWYGITDPYAEEWDLNLPMEVAPLLRRTKVVYYITQGPLIKIGKASNFPGRLICLEPDRVLAIEEAREPLKLEAQRHEEYRHLRVHGEWFFPGPDLLTHIGRLMEEI
jgi:hypothetical protein